ncbi:hypothetical protein E1176_06550 [Fulvivirga sp. RKSG066]|uniref:DUF6768 family protein n=1 Tax=Fulvivirga aurantia TaxID=2529383 RepID=UPI0012BD737E|nr:DUF6768 family protein [Fulvivirga aurantia]MTI20675.1 hypothetical protein [Fulvivirga aurantia]
MKHTTEEIDKVIHDALNREEAEFYDQLGEQSLLEMSLGVFQGKNKGIYILTIIVSVLLFAGFVYCAIQFFQTENTREMIIYGAIAFYCILSVTAVKLWHWMQMNTNQVLREMKRLELQISALASKK